MKCRICNNETDGVYCSIDCSLRDKNYKRVGIAAIDRYCEYCGIKIPFDERFSTSYHNGRKFCSHEHYGLNRTKLTHSLYITCRKCGRKLTYKEYRDDAKKRGIKAVFVGLFLTRVFCSEDCAGNRKKVKK